MPEGIIQRGLEWLFGDHWKTTLSAVVTAVAGFVCFSPDTFRQWPWLVEVCKYVAAGGLLSLGIVAADRAGKPH